MSDWGFESIFHFTVNATNFERSLAFYQTLGFQLLRDNRDVVWPDFVAGNFGMKKAQGRGALLALGPGPEHTRIDLIEWLEPAYDPAPALTQLDVPVLAVFGDLDLQVSAEDNAPAAEAALAGNPDATVVVLEGVNHLFQSATTGAVSEYQTLDEPFEPETTNPIVDWIETQT